ncbi:hypothetical protein [Plantactinospora sp. GCM10030261]|uniref:hypothetical protein n=1 Tax=Plantactinospora sp. GCM10030261 TaxID=3273420 RepID=UPI00361FA526
MVNIFRRKATALALGAVAFAVLGGGIAVAAPDDSPRAQPGAGSRAGGGPVSEVKGGAQPPVSKAAAAKARNALVPETTAGMPPTAQSFFAVVDPDGSLVRGFEAVSAQRFGPGEYEVIFSHDVTGSAFVGTVALNDDEYIPPPGEIAVAPRLDTPNGVYVATYNSAGQPADRAFHLAVLS